MALRRLAPRRARDPVRVRRRRRRGLPCSARRSTGRRRRAGDGAPRASRTRRGRRWSSTASCTRCALAHARTRDLGRRPAARRSSSAFRTRVERARRRARRTHPRRRAPVDPEVRSPMPGTVVSVDVATGDSVVAGQILLTIEAMKMEHRIARARATASSPSRSDRPTRWHSTSVVATITPSRTPDEGTTGHELRTRPPSSRRLARRGARLRRHRRRARRVRVRHASASCRTRSSPRWARWACSACPSRRSTAARAGTTSTSASRSSSSARVDQSIAVTLEAGVGLGAMPVFRSGTEAQKQEWLPMLAQGKALAAFGLTEADAGSDAAGTKTTARARRTASGSSTAPSSSSPTPAPRSRGW